MDSLKIPKAGLSSSPTNSVGMKTSNSSGVPISVHFNAGEESVDDIFPSLNVNNGSPSNSNNTGANVIGVSTNNMGGSEIGTQPNASPSHQLQNSQANVDEQARNFLQGNFFNKRSSIEGASPTSLGPNLIAALAANADSSSRGTWKLFKGKVTQKIEDIKLSKSNSQNSLPITAAKDDPDSDMDNIFVDPALIDDPVVEKYTKQHQHHHGLFKNLMKPTRPDSDSDNENEPGSEGLEIEPSRLRRGFENLKQRVKAKTTQPQITVTATMSTAKSAILAKNIKKGSSPTRPTAPLPVSSSAPLPVPSAVTSSSAAAGPTHTTTVKTGFLRRRRKQVVEAADAAADDPIEMKPSASELPAKTKKSFASGGGIQAGRKEIEIESGVEMLEDMIPQAVATAASTTDSALPDPLPGSTGSSQRNSKHLNMELPLEGLLPSLIPSQKLQQPEDNANNSQDSKESSKALTMAAKLKAFATNMLCLQTLVDLMSKHFKSVVRFGPALMCGLLFFCILMPIPDFVKGVLACLISIMVLESLGKVTQNVIESFLAKHQPEKCKFQIPDYTKMPICRLPAVEEHKNCKYYSGWMNEANTYDPNTFHLSQTKSVFLKLEGSILQVSTTNARIPKRVMWNDPPIDLSKILFTSHRVFNLLECRIELLPLGLAKKRFFNRKYPIQLIIKNGQKVKQGSSSSLAEKSSGQEATMETSPPTEATKEAFLVVGFGSTDSRTKSETDFAATVLNADLQPLQDLVNPDEDLKDITVPCGDEVRLLLFSRGDREKEDWYRRFVAASVGNVHDHDLGIPNLRLVDDEDIQAAASKSAQQLINSLLKNNEEVKVGDDSAAWSSSAAKSSVESKTPDEPPCKTPSEEDKAGLATGSVEQKKDDESVNGMIMSTCVSRNPIDYIQFMAIYQAACSDHYIPVFKRMDKDISEKRRQSRHRRFRSKDNELWHGIDQNLFLGPSGSVVWANVLIGRLLFSCLNDTLLHGKIQEFLQKKINSLRLPSFMEEVLITEINVGNTPPLIHRISQPLLDERGVWLDADITYEGLANITVTTKLNLLRLKRPTRGGTSNTSSQATSSGLGIDSTSLAPPSVASTGGSLSSEGSQTKLTPDWQLMEDLSTEDPVSKSGNAIYDSNAESSGGSDSESDSFAAPERTEANPSNDFFTPTSSSPGNARRIFKLVDKITTSQIFQYATELSYVQRAMENMNATITLRVDIKGVVGRATINMPPPPSDRIWLCFRTPPRLWISGHPTVGDKSVDWSIVTNVIESKLCEEVNKYLVFPNMVDISIPFLGQPTYCSPTSKEKE